MQSKQYFTKIKNYPHEKSTEPHYMLLVAVTEGEKLINILFHFCSSNQHEVEYKNQNKQIDGKTADAAHQKLADAGEYGCYRAYVFFA